MLQDNETTYAAWPHHFELRLRLVLMPAKLTMELRCTNTDPAPFTFTGALHTYFRVPDVRRIAIVGKGLEGSCFVAHEDMGDGQPAGTVRRMSTDEIVFGGYLDRNYYDAPAALRIVAERPCPTEPAEALVLIEKSGGFRDCVVWNPWKERADAMADMGTDEWLNFVCVEAAAVKPPVALAPGESWTASQTVSGSPSPARL